MRDLPPWLENPGKRQVESPKVCLRDSGQLHSLPGIASFAALEAHPQLGPSWEGFALEEALGESGDRDACLWSTQSGAELDLHVFPRGERLGFELKDADAPAVTKSLQIARSDMKLARPFVVHPGEESFPINDWTEVRGPQKPKSPPISNRRPKSRAAVRLWPSRDTVAIVGVSSFRRFSTMR